MRRACQSRASLKMAMRGRAGPTRRSTGSAERGIEQALVDAAGAEALAAVDRGDDHFRRAEQHRIDGIEITVEPAKDLGEGSSMVAGIARGQLFGESPRILGGAGHEEPDPGAVNDGVVGAAESLQEIGMGGC